MTTIGSRDLTSCLDQVTVPRAPYLTTYYYRVFVVSSGTDSSHTPATFKAPAQQGLGRTRNAGTAGDVSSTGDSSVGSNEVQVTLSEPNAPSGAWSPDPAISTGFMLRVDNEQPTPPPTATPAPGATPTAAPTATPVPAATATPAPGSTPAPQPTPTPTPFRVGPNTIIRASGLSTLDYDTCNGQSVGDDIVSWDWSCPDGTFLDATDSGNTRWRAPSAPGDYTITWTVDDGTGGPMGAGSTGSRDDAPVSVRKVVRVDLSITPGTGGGDEPTPPPPPGCGPGQYWGGTQCLGDGPPGTPPVCDPGYSWNGTSCVADGPPGGATPTPGGPTPTPGGVTPTPGGPTPTPTGYPGDPTPTPGGPTPTPGGPTPTPGGPTPTPGGATPTPGPSPTPTGYPPGGTPTPGPSPTPTGYPPGGTPTPGGPTPTPGDPTPTPGGPTPTPGGPTPTPTATPTPRPTPDGTIGTSEASIELYKRGPDDNGNFAATAKVTNTPVGGKLWAVLELKVGHRGRVDASQPPNSSYPGTGPTPTPTPPPGDIQQVTIRLKENADDANGVTHPRTENHIDIPVDLTNPYNWEQLMPADSAHDNKVWWQSIAYPKAENNSGQTIIYRYRYEWQTTTHQDRYDPEPTPTPVPGEPTPTPAGYPGSGGYPGGSSGPAPGDTRLWGHNGSHTASLVAVNGDYRKTQVRFQSLLDDWTWSTPSASGPDAKDANVQNLVITEAKARDKDAQGNITYNPDYFKFDPESTEPLLTNPEITFTIQDLGDPHRYRWWVWVMPTWGEQNSIELKGIMTGPGTKTVTINQPAVPDTQTGGENNMLSEWGTYTFDIRVEEIKNDQELGIGEPWVDLRSTKLFIPLNYTDDNGMMQPGHSVQFVSPDDSVDTQVKVSYYLEDSPDEPLSNLRNASEMQISFLDGDQNQLASIPGQLEVRTPRKDVLLYTFQGDEYGGTLRTLFSGADSHTNLYRDHKPRRMAPTNQPSPLKAFHIEDDWMLDKTGGSNPASWLSLNPQARDPNIAKVFLRANWKALNTTNDSKHIGSGQVGNAPYQQSISNLTEFSNNSFENKDNRHSSSTSHRHWNYRSLFRQWGERFVHVIGAAYESGPNATPIAWGRSSPSARFSYVYVRQLMAIATPPVTSPSAIRIPIIKATTHEIGHQFGTKDDHLAGDEDLNTAEAAVLQRLTSSDPTIRAQALKDLAEYRGRAIRAVDSADDYYECVQTDGFPDDTRDYIFCPYHNKIIQGYKGW